MTSSSYEISTLLDEMGQLAPAGFAMGLHIHYTTPRFMFQTYSRDWLEYYSRNGLLISDPMVAWGFENTGTVRWSELSDPTGVLAKAAEFGMPYGMSCATEEGGLRSIGGFACADGEFTSDEIREIHALFLKIHNLTAQHAELPQETVDELHKMSVIYTHPNS